jgi:hypothetical protein
MQPRIAGETLPRREQRNQSPDGRFWSMLLKKSLVTLGES